MASSTSDIPNGHPYLHGQRDPDGLSQEAPFHVAIIGGGVIGLCIARGLVTRHIPVTVYEQAPEIHELGVGLGFARCVMECLGALDQQLLEELGKMSIRGQGIRWVDGTRQEDLRLRPENQLSDFEISDDHYATAVCQRAHFVDAIIKLLPEGCLKLGKRLVKFEEKDTGKVSLEFGDGETGEADALIGCDGVKSFVRRAVVGEDDPSSVAHFAKEVAWRCLVDMEKVLPIMGDYTKKIYWWHGPGAHVITYPVANYKFLNVGAFLHTEEWRGGSSTTAHGSKREVVEAFSRFGPLIRGVVDTLPEELNLWAMFDTLDHPLRSFAFGNVVLAGDAAHAMTPHNGNGAGQGIEDGLVLVTLLDQVAETLRKGQVDAKSKPRALADAFQAYSRARRERAQLVVSSSRRQGFLQKWLDLDIGNDTERLVRDTRERYDGIFWHDWKGMVNGARKDLETRLRTG